MEENKEVTTTETNVEEKKELTDIMLVCMILLTFQYSFTGDDKSHLTIDELFDKMSKYFIVEKSKIESTLYEMCVGNICGQWLRKYPDGTEINEYTLTSFQLKDGNVRVIDTTP
jgi:hypothetical protein